MNPDGSFAGYIGSCIDVTDHKLAEEALADIGRRLIEAHEEERAWIARELHDDINQRIAMLAIDVDRWDEDVPKSAVEVHDHIHHVHQHLSDLGRDVQALSHRLHSSKLDYLGLAAAASGFCKELSEQQKVEIDFSQAAIPRSVPKEISLCLFRVLQEALQNAVKHSGVRHFTVDLCGTSREIRLTVSDLGIGFDQQDASTVAALGSSACGKDSAFGERRVFHQVDPAGAPRSVLACPLWRKSFVPARGVRIGNQTDFVDSIRQK